MCTFSSEESPYDVPLAFTLHYPKNQHHHLRLSFHKRRRRAQLKEARRRQRMIVMKTEMIMKMRNLKLYMENQNIIENNEKLRKQAVLLNKENQALLFQLQNKISEHNNYKTN